MDIKRYQELDALRGMAALMVVLFHLTMTARRTEVSFMLGTTGVDLFFIISGFVIFMSLNKVKKGYDFLINRCIRLYPTYWTAVSFTFFSFSVYCILKNSPQDISPVSYLGNMSMFQHYLNIKDLEGPYWTMIIEMIFYIGIWFLFHFNFIKHINSIGIIICLSTVVATQLWPGHSLVKSILYWVPLLQFTPLFFAGIIFYKIYEHRTDLVKYYLMIFLCFLCQIALFEFAGRSRAFIAYLEYIWMLTLYFGVFTLFVNNSLKFIVNVITLFLGKISFALYLIHQNISNHFLIPLFQVKLNFGFWPALTTAVVICILIATFITFFIEEPVIKKLKEQWARYKTRIRPGDLQEHNLLESKMETVPVRRSEETDVFQR